MKKSILALILALVMILALAACGTSTTDSGSQGSGGASTPADTGSAAGGSDAETPSSDGKTYELTFASMFPAGSPYDTKITAYIDEQLREKSGGRLGLQVYAGESLVATANVIDAVSSGMADMGIMYMAAAPGRFPVSQLFELPNCYASGAAATYAYMDFYNEYSEAFTEFDGVKVLALYASGPGVLISQEKIPNVASYSGYQLSSQSTQASAVLALGGTPISNILPEVYESLRTGVLDGYIGS